jgi:transposase-like protein
MTEPTSAQDLFKGRHFDQEIIVLCVRWYLTFKLSSRDLVQMRQCCNFGIQMQMGVITE